MYKRIRSLLGNIITLTNWKSHLKQEGYLKSFKNRSLHPLVEAQTGHSLFYYECYFRNLEDVAGITDLEEAF